MQCDGQCKGRDVILLTGGTGFLGSFLLHALSHSTAERYTSCESIVCLVRAKTDETAQERLRASLAAYGLWDATVAKRVRAVAGDLSKPLLGLEILHHLLLASSVKCVFHCAAHVSSVMPYAALRNANVCGTRRVLQLALLFKDAETEVDVCHVSTMGFVPPDVGQRHGRQEGQRGRRGQRGQRRQGGGTSGEYDDEYGDDEHGDDEYGVGGGEDNGRGDGGDGGDGGGGGGECPEPVEVPVGNLDARSGYAQSKWVADRLVTSLMRRGRPRPRSLCVFRPGVVAGHAETGASNPKDAGELRVVFTNVIDLLMGYISFYSLFVFGHLIYQLVTYFPSFFIFAVNMLLMGLITERFVTVDPASPITRVFNMCPVDYVADTIVRVCGERWTVQGTEERETDREAEERETESDTKEHTEVKAARVFVAHLCATHNVTLETMCGWVRAAGYVLDDVSTELFIRRLEDEVTEETHPLFPLKSFLNTPKKNQLNQVKPGRQTSQRKGRTVNSEDGGGDGGGGGGNRAAAAGGTFSSVLSSVFGDVFRGGGEVRRSRREPSTKVREDREEREGERKERKERKDTHPERRY